MKSHFAAVHMKKKENFQCEFCNFETMEMSTFTEHRNKVHKMKQQLKCLHCVYTTGNREALKSHFAAVHMKKKEDFQCESCDYSTPWKECLQSHINAEHLTLESRVMSQQSESQAESHLMEISKTNLAKEDVTLKTTEVDYDDDDDDDDDDTIDIKEFSLPIMEDEIEAGVIDKYSHVAAKHKETTACDVAAKQYHLHQHVVVKSNSFSFKCAYCDYSAPFKNRVLCHVRSIHIKMRPFKCEHCDYAAKSKWNLAQHVKSIHEKRQTIDIEESSLSIMGDEIEGKIAVP